MPNWCSNVVTLSHPDLGQVERARDAFLAGKLLQTFFPCPEELRNPDSTSYGGPENKKYETLRSELTEKYGYANWHDWCVDNWGTKWDVTADGMTTDDYPVDGNSISISFDSAWAPPVMFYIALEEQGWTVDAFYYEPGMNFCGRFTDGINDSYDIEDDPQWVLDNIPDEINEMFNISTSMEDMDFEEFNNEDEEY